MADADIPEARRELPSGLRPGGRYAAWAPGVPAYVVADVDGTLIARGTTATPAVAAAVADAAAAGLRVGFATGRLPVGVRALQDQLRTSGPHIVHNGAQVWSDGRPLATWPLAAASAERLLERCLELALYAELYVADGYYVTDRRAEVQPTWERINGQPAGLASELDLRRTEVIKATVVAFAPDALPAILAQVRALGLLPEAAPSPLFPAMRFVNVTSPDVGKGPAVEFAATHVGIALADVVAVGDGMNDLSMLEVAGTAIAMGQAPLELQVAAHVVVPEVEADGVAHALRAAAAWRAAAGGHVPRGS